MDEPVDEAVSVELCRVDVVDAALEGELQESDRVGPIGVKTLLGIFTASIESNVSEQTGRLIDLVMDALRPAAAG